MLKNHTNKRYLCSLAENVFFMALFAFISSLCEHRNHGGVVSAFFLLQQLPPYEVVSSDPWPTSAAEAENELKRDGYQQQIATNEPNNNCSKVAGENATTMPPTPTAISSANNSLFSVRVDINEHQQQQLKEEKFNSTSGMDKIVNLSTTPNAAEIEDQNISNKSSELESMEHSIHDSHSPFNHFHPLGFINAVRHKKMLRKIRKLVAKGVHKYPF